jgi:hypothetical protein
MDVLRCPDAIGCSVSYGMMDINKTTASVVCVAAVCTGIIVLLAQAYGGLLAEVPPHTLVLPKAAGVSSAHHRPPHVDSSTLSKHTPPPRHSRAACGSAASAPSVVTVVAGAAAAAASTAECSCGS